MVTKKEMLKDITKNPISFSAFSGMISNQLIEQKKNFTKQNIILTVMDCLTVKETIMEMTNYDEDF